MSCTIFNSCNSEEPQIETNGTVEDKDNPQEDDKQEDLSDKLLGYWLHQVSDNYYVAYNIMPKGKLRELDITPSTKSVWESEGEKKWTNDSIFLHKIKSVTANTLIIVKPQVYRDYHTGLLGQWTFCRIIESEWESLLSGEIPKSFKPGGGNSGGGNSGGGNTGTVTEDILCKNGGVWLYSYTHSYKLTYTQYCKSTDQFDFTKNGSVTVHTYWECNGKNYKGIWETRKSEVFAVGTYRLDSNVLKCEFTNVMCSGNSDIETKYWTQGTTNYKNYDADYDESDATLSLINGKEAYYLSQPNNQGSGGGSSSYEVPDISFYDVTPGKNSLEVSYRIWNKDKCGSLSNARIYYGTSSANKRVNATVSGVYIKAKITGLSKGTEYQVKCSVTGSGGSATTEESTLSTLY